MDGHRARATYNPDVTLGNIIQIAVLMVTVALAYSTLDKRIALVEQAVYGKPHPSGAVGSGMHAAP